MSEVEIYKKCMREIGINQFENMTDAEIIEHQKKDVMLFEKIIYNLGFDYLNIRFSTKEELDKSIGKDKYTCAAFYISYKYNDDAASIILPFKTYYTMINVNTDNKEVKEMLNGIAYSMIQGFREMILPKYGETLTNNIMKSIEMRSYERNKVIIN